MKLFTLKKYLLGNRLDFLKKTHTKIQRFPKRFFKFIKVIFFFKFFWKLFLKLTIYLIFFKLYTSTTAKINKKYLLIILKKKKSSYILSTYLKKGLLISISVGCILQYFKFKKKFIKKQKKGFLLFLNVFKQIFLKFKAKYFNKNVFINFFNFYLIFFWKKLKFLTEKQHDLKLFFNFNTHNSLIRIKKIKAIKKRLYKKNLKNFLTDWNLIKFTKNQDLKFKVK